LKDITISEEIAALGERLKYEDISLEVLTNAKKFILDVTGVILGAKEVTSSKIITDTVFELGGNPESTVMGHGVKTSPMMAALANGVQGHAMDFDDDHREGTQHSSVVVFPALLALAEKYGATGKEFLTAFILGSEVTIRLGEAFLGQTYYQGFHPTGTCGVFGAAAGAMKLLKLDKEKMVMTLGIAASQAAGIGEFNSNGSWTKRFHAGHSAMGGVLSAMLASKGYTGPRTVFEGKDGFMRAFSYKDQYDCKIITNDLGKRWDMNDVSIKVHACCRFSAPLADCAVDLYHQGVNPDEITEVLAKANNFTIRQLCFPEDLKVRPQNVVNAQFSLPYAIAVGIIKGRASVPEFTDEAIKDPKVLELAAKVKWEVDPEIEAVYPKRYPATVIVKTKSGKEYTAHVEFPKGDTENPVSFEEAIEKFRFVAGLTIGASKVERIIDIISNLEKVEDMRALIPNLY
jgi:2-methylcitrate dehydratase PrpD